jgi:hypothetical protein
MRLCEAIKQSATSLAHGFNNNCYLLSGSSLILLTSLSSCSSKRLKIYARSAEQSRLQGMKELLLLNAEACNEYLFILRPQYKRCSLGLIAISALVALSAVVSTHLKITTWKNLARRE